MKRSNSVSSVNSLSSWLSVSDISWVEVEEQAAAQLGDPELMQKPEAELIQEARESLDCMSLKCLQELKCLAKPPAGVAESLATLMHLLAGISPQVEVTAKGNVKRDDWKEGKKLLGNPGQLIKELNEFPALIDAGKVPRRNIQNARKIQLAMGPEFSDTLKKKSMAAGCLWVWVQNICAYYAIAAPPAPPAAPAEPPMTTTVEDNAPAPPAASRFLSKADIVELKSVNCPPDAVKDVLAVVGLLLNGKENMDWGSCKRMLADGRFLQKLCELDIHRIPKESLAEAKVLATEAGIGVKSLASQSKAVVGLAMWVQDVLQKTSSGGDDDAHV